MNCNDCGNPGEAKTSKAQRVYFNCNTCPSNNPSYPAKFLCFLDELEAYKKKGSSPRQGCPAAVKKVVGAVVPKKRKADAPPEDDQLGKRLDSLNEKIIALISRQDVMLDKIEKLLAGPQSEEESEETTE